MKYIKTYKLFEFRGHTNTPLEDDQQLMIDDIMLDCTDLDMSVMIRKRSMNSGADEDSWLLWIDSPKYKSHTVTGLSCDREIKFSEIKDSIYHLISYMKSIGYSKFRYRDEKTGFNNNGSYINFVKLPSFFKPITSLFKKEKELPKDNDYVKNVTIIFTK